MPAGIPVIIYIEKHTSTYIIEKKIKLPINHKKIKKELLVKYDQLLLIAHLYHFQLKTGTI
jgi:hypothetical protein